MNPDDFIDKIIQGNTIDVLQQMPDNCIDLVITSPPYYGLRNYKVDEQIGLEESFDEYLNKLLEITAELKRVLKKTGQLWWNHGDCYGSNNANWQGIEKWRSGNKNIKNLQYKGKKVSEKCLLLQPERLALRMIDEQGWILRNKVIWCRQVLIKKENKTIGRVMPSSVKDRFNESWEYLYFFTKSKKYYSNLDAVRIPAKTFTDWKNQSRPQMQWKNEAMFNLRVRGAQRKAGQLGYVATKEEIERYKQETLPWNPITNGRIYQIRRGRDAKYNDPDYNLQNTPAGIINATWDKSGVLYNPLGKNLPTVWQINPEAHNFRKELRVDVDHFAAFPEELVEIPIKFGCPEGGIMLDPFAGSGTTCCVAKKFGRHYIGIEINPKYCEIAEKRLARLPVRLDKYMEV